MQRTTINAADAPIAAGGYAQAILIDSPMRLLFISGQIPIDRNGAMPDDFHAQCRLVWRNLDAQLQAAGMTLDNLVKVTVFLADRAHAAANRQVREEVLGSLSPALAVIITGIFDTAWLVEIEAIAAA